MSGLLVTILILAIFVGAVCYVIQTLIPEPLKRWAWAILVVLVAIALIDMLSGGTVLGIHTWKR